MDSLKLLLRKDELVRALRVLSANRRARFSSIVPIWLDYDPRTCKLRLREDRGSVLAALPADGTWPSAGATVNLHMLHRAAKSVATDEIQLVCIEDAVLVPKRGLELSASEPPCPCRPSHSKNAHHTKGNLLCSEKQAFTGLRHVRALFARFLPNRNARHPGVSFKRSISASSNTAAGRMRSLNVMAPTPPSHGRASASAFYPLPRSPAGP